MQPEQLAEDFLGGQRSLETTELREQVVLAHACDVRSQQLATFRQAAPDAVVTDTPKRTRASGQAEVNTALAGILRSPII